MSEFKRCPLCGIEFVIEEDERYKYYTHPSVGCFFDNLPILVDDEDTIRKWNTRKPMQNIVERLEEYRDDFMDDIYEELREDADNCRANRIIERFDEAIGIVKEEGDRYD